MDTIGIGVIGCGTMGKSLVLNLIKLDPRLKVVALFDPGSEVIETMLQELDSEPTVCKDYQSLVEMPEVQWVMIASWNCFHCEQAVAAFEAGKHVFCQKPLALTVDECDLMLKAWEKSGKVFNIGFTLRYSPHYRKVKELITDGNIGKIISMEFNETLGFNHGGYIMADWRRLRKNAGTHLLEKCCHDIDLVNWMIESRAKRVASFGGLNFYLPENEYHIKRIGKHHGGGEAYSAWATKPLELNPFLCDKDIIDNQVAILEYENGVRSTFHTNCNAGILERRMYINGTEGTIRADVLTGTIELRKIGFGNVVEDESTGASGGHGDGDAVLAAELAETMLNQVMPPVGLLEGLESAVTCFAIDEAMDSGTVVDVGPYWEKLGLN